MLHFKTSEQYNVSCTLTCESDLSRGVSSPQNQSKNHVFYCLPLRIRFRKWIYTSNVNFKVCVGWGFLNHNLLNPHLKETKYYLYDRKTLIKPYDPLICLLTTKTNSHVMRHKSFWSGNIFSIFSVMHIYTPISPTMKPDPPKTKH